MWGKKIVIIHFWICMDQDLGYCFVDYLGQVRKNQAGYGQNILKTSVF